MARPANTEARTKPESLEDFVNKSEDAARAMGLVVGHIEHPDAVTGTIFNGRFAGIRVTKKDTSRALLSTGVWLD